MGDCPLSSLLISGIRLDGATLVLAAEGADDAAACPSCGEAARRVHDRYVRSPRDLPWRGFAVRLDVTVRRFCCDHAACRRKTFAEDFGPPLARRRRFTADALGALRAVAQAAGARPARSWPADRACRRATTRCCGCCMGWKHRRRPRPASWAWTTWR